MPKNKGFTLIELLAVIAIIGALAAIVLVNLQESKKTGQDGSIAESLTQIKNAAELQFNQEYTYANICDDAGGLFGTTAAVDFGRIESYINERHGVIVCRDSETGWAVASSLNKGGCWCVDSQGNSKKFNVGAGQACGDVLIAGAIVCP